jgi:hypothetical protein
MVISGHVHQSPFIPDGSWFDRLGATWVFNAGLQPGRPPVHIVLDIEDGKAFWLAAGDEQFIDLNAPLRRPAAPVADPRRGLHPWVGLQIRSWRDLYRRQVDHALQDLADHREVIAVAGILLHNVGKIGGGDIKPLRQQPRDQERHRRLLAQKRCGIADLVNG